MADNTQTKTATYVQSTDWGIHQPTVEYLQSPTRTIYTRTESANFQITINHPTGTNPPAQTHEGKTIKMTLCDGNWTIECDS